MPLHSSFKGRALCQSGRVAKYRDTLMKNVVSTATKGMKKASRSVCAGKFSGAYVVDLLDNISRCIAGA